MGRVILPRLCVARTQRASVACDTPISRAWAVVFTAVGHTARSKILVLNATRYDCAGSIHARPTALINGPALCDNDPDTECYVREFVAAFRSG